ncbi:MAG: sterol desaturase family protein [Alphaproteobacteria bacterium]|nr:sterol desaturase family protein [Alphaproteobacteria bacterium]
MELDLDSGRLAVFLGGLSLFLLLETVFPARPWQTGRAKRLFFHASLAAVNTVLVRILIYVPLLLWIVHVEEQGWGVARWLGLHDWQEVVVSLIALDLFDYFWHRANHVIPLLWRFHKAHHHDSEMDVSTALRFHPGELFLSAFAKASWVLIWGPSAMAWFVFEGLISLCAQFHHSNIDLPAPIDRWLRRVVVTPRFHTSHHAVERAYGHANYSTIFSFWDPLFGTYRMIPRAQLNSEAIGLPEARDLTLSYRAWFAEPFMRRNTGLPD